MSRFSALCGFLIIFALIGSIVGGKSSGEGSSGSCSRCARKNHSGSSYWYGLDRYIDFGLSRAEIKEFGKKIGRGWSSFTRTRFALSMRFKNKWRGVRISTCDEDKGILRARQGIDPLYDFYLDKDCNNGHTTGVKPKYTFSRDDIKSQTRDGRTVKMNMKGGTTVKIKFATDDDALMYHGWEWD